MDSAIPVQNLYYLFCYAWNHFKDGQAIDVGTEESPDLPNLLAKVLINGTRHLLRRGLYRGYILHQEDTSCLRGRIDFSETVKRNLLHQARAHCTFDEFSYDVPHNQVLKTTLYRLAKLPSVDKGLREDLRRLCRTLDGVQSIRVSRRTFRDIHIHRNNAFYDFIIRLCELAYESLLPETAGGSSRFANILNDEDRMGQVFESFVRNFYRMEQNDFTVRGERIDWDVEAEDEKELASLPFMYTDITLRSPERTIVIDTKYYSQTMQKHRGRTTLRSSHLYQLFAYLKNFGAANALAAPVEGILLYPTVGETLDTNFVLQEHPVRVCTVNLDQDWRGIHADLLRILESEGVQRRKGASSRPSAGGACINL